MLILLMLLILILVITQVVEMGQREGIMMVLQVQIILVILCEAMGYSILLVVGSGE